jgi:hypothetical protein
MTVILRLGLLTAALWLCQYHVPAFVFAFAFAPQYATKTKATTTPRQLSQSSSTLVLLYATTNNNNDNNNNNDAQELLDRAAKLRAEIAAMEGKTVEQVETEARTKKELELQRKQDAELEKASRKTSSASMTSSTTSSNEGRFLQVPNTPDDMVRQAAQAIERAFKDGKTRQTVRFNLIAQNQAVADENEWPGGAQQMYREAGKPLTTALLREIHAPTKHVEGQQQQQRLPPTIKEQDIWDFDGSALHTAEAKLGASGDVQALVFPNTDVKYMNDIAKVSDAMGPRLFLLINPFWRNVESWSFDILAPGAKQKAQKVIFDNGYDETYVVLSFQARGEKCVALKAYPYDWQLFAYIEDNEYGTGMESVIRLGSCQEDPTSAVVTGLLNERPEFKETKTMRQLKKIF